MRGWNSKCRRSKVNKYKTNVQGKQNCVQKRKSSYDCNHDWITFSHKMLEMNIDVKL